MLNIKKVILAISLVVPLCSTLASRPAHATVVEYDEYELQELLSDGQYFLDAGFEAFSSAETLYFTGDLDGALTAALDSVLAFDAAIDRFTRAGALGNAGARDARDGRGDVIEFGEGVRQLLGP